MKYFLKDGNLYSGPVASDGTLLFGIPEGAIEVTQEQALQHMTPPPRPIEELTDEVWLKRTAALGRYLFDLIDGIPAGGNAKLLAVKSAAEAIKAQYPLPGA